ncbi:hypothetical protein CLV58_12443 [Spirosoma oryzae]|uniref:Uncharacterized protein n=1 Tax=Spirosoma oryzae TaxID=1469603 RepID=A0A2T0SAI6_9BACT|nr:hypothetical protein CLV58_12443 [Spirosoma oryzae]
MEKEPKYYVSNDDECVKARWTIQDTLDGK